MNSQAKILECYNKIAKHYGDTYINELSQKHMDRILLRAFLYENEDKGKMIDLGCGPGQTTCFLYESGNGDIIGIDFSINMISIAKKFNNKIQYEIQDILDLKYTEESFGSAIAFYSFVHFDYLQIETAIKNVYRILIDGGDFLFSFHIGNDYSHVTKLLGEDVDINFNYFEIDVIQKILKDAGFRIVDIIEREHYSEVEHPKRRAYVWVSKVS